MVEQQAKKVQEERNWLINQSEQVCVLFDNCARHTKRHDRRNLHLVSMENPKQERLGRWVKCDQNPKKINLDGDLLPCLNDEGRSKSRRHYIDNCPESEPTNGRLLKKYTFNKKATMETEEGRKLSIQEKTEKREFFDNTRGIFLKG